MVDSAGVDHFTSLEDGKTIGEIEHEGNVLLHNEHRRPGLAAGRSKNFREPVDDGRLQAFRDFVEQEEPRRCDQAGQYWPVLRLSPSDCRVGCHHNRRIAAG